jgi:hypothetical protein
VKSGNVGVKTKTSKRPTSTEPAETPTPKKDGPEAN